MTGFFLLRDCEDMHLLTVIYQNSSAVYFPSSQETPGSFVTARKQVADGCSVEDRIDLNESDLCFGVLACHQCKEARRLVQVLIPGGHLRSLDPCAIADLPL